MNTNDYIEKKVEEYDGYANSGGISHIETLKFLRAALEEAYRAGENVHAKLISESAASALASYRNSLIEKVEAHARQNTYEGDEALVYHTTMQEVLDLLRGEERATCPKWEKFDADGWLSPNDAYCLNCLREDCPNKPKVPREETSQPTS